ncbi:sensor histidine kinase [Enterococcus pallens]|uniref:histidine kinase n=2 Tax=Enterococcus pallens TaxID=160454 RepID=R2SFK1_9ENTE|nr:HAMP domain-containing sensor histidine kinase [Enterococcus pallens]EOH94150.1 hypothetical protein UAU_01885 [Enterococcus pallens ATCC BAA-351]EOU24029.1 hypothetical protein I588_00016 [Enterococcus pallens ATCC BAA-351]
MLIKKFRKILSGYLKSKLLLRLWAGNMILVVLVIAFLWVVQIKLFEPNYLNATMEDMYVRVQENAYQVGKIPNIDAVRNDNPLHFLSKTVVGLVMLVDSEGHVLYAYNSGRLADTQNLEADYSWLLKNYQVAQTGETFKDIQPFVDTTAIAMAIPTTYQEKPASIMLYNVLTQIDTMLSINRHQLFILSILLTLVASLISFILAKHFSKPILKIEETVADLTRGNFSATPDIHRNDELGRLSDSVAQLGMELQRLEILRKEVIANVSHELRSPLALITGYAEMIRDVTGDDRTTRKKNLDLVIRESNRMSTMVDDIMDYSQLQAGYSKLNIDQINLYSLVESASEYGKGIAAQYDIAVELQSFSTEIVAEIDGLKIGQVMRNLLNNAINHTKNLQTILVTITYDKEGVKVSIANPGDPIPPDQLNQIWERYQRVQHQGGHKEGTGIGLAIVSTILNAHAIPYGAESQDGETIFWFMIPKARITLKKLSG